MARSEEEEFILSLPRFATETFAKKHAFDFIISEHYFSRVEQLCSFVFIMYTTFKLEVIARIRCSLKTNTK